MKETLFVYRYENLEDVFKDPTNNPTDFLLGLNYVNMSKHKVVHINAPRLLKRKGLRQLFWLFELFFSRLTRLGFPLEIYWMFKKKITQADDIVCVNDQISLGILFWKTIGLMRKKRVHCVIMSLPERLKYFSHHRWLVRFISRLLNQATTIFILSKCVKKEFVEKYSIKNQDKVKIFYFGVDIEFWKPEPKILCENNILSIGNDMNRDFFTLIQALPNYAKLKIVTNKKIGSLNKNVEFFSKLSNSEVRIFYNQALFIVIPNIKLQNESSGLSCCLQAMACGKAVIIADAPPLRELFEEGKHCLFYDPENSVDLKNKIELLLNNQQLRESLAKNSYDLVFKNYTCKQMGVVLESVLSST